MNHMRHHISQKRCIIKSKYCKEESSVGFPLFERALASTSRKVSSSIKKNDPGQISMSTITKKQEDTERIEADVKSHMNFHGYFNSILESEEGVPCHLRTDPNSHQHPTEPVTDRLLDHYLSSQCRKNGYTCSRCENSLKYFKSDVLLNRKDYLATSKCFTIRARLIRQGHAA
jgi:hypothetical protein